MGAVGDACVARGEDSTEGKCDPWDTKETARICTIERLSRRLITLSYQPAYA